MELRERNIASGKWADSEIAESSGLIGRATGEDVGGHGTLGRRLSAVAGQRGDVGEQCPEAVEHEENVCL